MTEEKNIRDIADSSVPNAGRIYDFLLGGNHNFEIDRQIAKQILQVAPFMSEFFRLIRWFLDPLSKVGPFAKSVFFLACSPFFTPLLS